MNSGLEEPLEECLDVWRVETPVVAGRVAGGVASHDDAGGGRMKKQPLKVMVRTVTVPEPPGMSRCASVDEERGASTGSSSAFNSREEIQDHCKGCTPKSAAGQRWMVVPLWVTPSFRGGCAMTGLRHRRGR